MTESEQLTEGSYVYTDLCIEQVHWCEVNGEKELVTPKGYIHGEVPSYEQWKMTKNLSERAHLEMYKARGEKVRLENENTQLKELLKECSYRIDWRIRTSDNETQKLFDKISQVLGEE